MLSIFKLQRNIGGESLSPECYHRNCFIFSKCVFFLYEPNWVSMEIDIPIIVFTTNILLSILQELAGIYIIHQLVSVLFQYSPYSLYNTCVLLWYCFVYLRLILQVSLGDYVLPPDKRMEHLQGIPRCSSAEYTEPYETSKLVNGMYLCSVPGGILLMIK